MAEVLLVSSFQETPFRLGMALGQCRTVELLLDVLAVYLVHQHR